MTRATDWPVVADDVRPARQDGTCFYCETPLGQQHAEGCVIRTRTVVVEVTLTLVRRVPEDWAPEMVDFHLNGSGWCGINIIKDLESLDRCLCPHLAGKFLREATAEDEDLLGVCS